MWCESFGSLHTDIYNLSTATAIFVSTGYSYPSIGSHHPFWSFMTCEKRTVTIEYGFTRAVCEYAGFEGSPEVIEEWSSGMSEEPIQTHPNFHSFAGSATAPRNGSLWEEKNGTMVFKEFWSNPPNKFSGVTSYLVPVLVKRLTSIQSTSISVQGTIGRLQGRLLCTSASSTRRGKVYTNVTEWRGAGPRGWNTEIYG
jgi:hypothetical protein